MATTAGLRRDVSPESIRTAIAVARSGITTFCDTLYSRVVEPAVYNNLRKRNLSTFLLKHVNATSLDGALQAVRNMPRIYIKPESEEACRVASFEKYPDQSSAIIYRASRHVNREFSVFQSSWVHLGTPVNWHYDFINDYMWPRKKLYWQSRWHPPIRGNDRVNWELSRLHHLVTLGQARVLTGQKAFADALVDHASEWIDGNPVGYGVNWGCTMDAGIRVVNMLVASEFLDLTSIPDNFIVKFAVSIFDHAQFILDHLEHNNGRANNHLIGDLVGLFFIGLKCPFFKESRAWLDFSSKALYAQARRQVHGDGASFEASTAYHKLGLEMLLHVLVAAGNLGRPFPSSFSRIVKKMANVAFLSSMPSGTIPQVGDNDDGRLLPFFSGDPLLASNVVDMSAIFFRDTTLKAERALPNFEALWMFGPAALNEWSSMEGKATTHSTIVKSIGWGILRSRDAYCFLSCGGNGQGGIGGHAHNDKLSIVLAVDGETLFDDPGTYVYAPSEGFRNLFRSTAFHNTLRVDGTEQNPLNAGMFRLPERVMVKSVFMKENGNVAEIRASLEHPGGIHHERTCILHKGDFKFEIIDSIFSSGDVTRVKLDYSFNLAVGITYDEKKGTIRGKHGPFNVAPGDNLQFSRARGFHSPSFSQLRRVDRMVATVVTRLPWRSIITIARGTD